MPRSWRYYRMTSLIHIINTLARTRPGNCQHNGTFRQLWNFTEHYGRKVPRSHQEVMCPSPPTPRTWYYRFSSSLITQNIKQTTVIVLFYILRFPYRNANFSIRIKMCVKNKVFAQSVLKPYTEWDNTTSFF